ncbi:hypothetical protein ACC710_36835, partial [Rhizobium ruizarguesonis]
RSDDEAAAGSRCRKELVDCVLAGRVTTTGGEKPAVSAMPAPASGRNSTVVNSCMRLLGEEADHGRLLLFSTVFLGAGAAFWFLAASDFPLV